MKEEEEKKKQWQPGRVIGKRRRTETDLWTERIKIDEKKNTRCQRTRVTLAMKTCERRREKFKNERKKTRKKSSRDSDGL